MNIQAADIDLTEWKEMLDRINNCRKEVHIALVGKYVKLQARKCGISLRQRWMCPKCGRMTFKPLNKANGWCAECTKEGHVADLREQASAMREEAARSKRNDRERQRCYSAKSRAKKSQK